MKKTYSFDVFDTCLCRLCGEPRLMFDVLSLKVQKAMGEDCSEHMRQLFVAARANAGGNNLTEIYNHVAENFPIPFSVEQMSKLELETEREMLAPIVATRELVDSLRQKGNVLFISDMYLPSIFIKERLVEYGFFTEGDQLYVSDELGAWKYDGSLYKLIHEREGIPYRNWNHYGDNRIGDYRVPRKLGIHAHHLHYDYLPYEEQWRQKPVLQYQYPAILAGVARATRLSSDAPEDQKAFVCDISAPLMVSWVLHIMNDAQSRGIKRLYFCARDMHSFFHISQVFRAAFPDIETKYLFISSLALQDTPNCFKYLCSQGFADNVPKAIVDTCTSGKTISILNDLLKLNGYKHVDGYFWGRMDIPGVNSTTGYYLMDGSYIRAMTNKRVSSLFGMRILYEVLFSLNYHQKTIGYEYHQEIIRPIFRKDEEDQWVIDNRSIQSAKTNNDKLLCSFAKAIAQTDVDDYYHALFEHTGIPTLVEFLDRPKKIYLGYLHNFKWWNRKFVGSILGREQGVWKRGSLFYSLPRLITSPLRVILSDDKKRRQLNQMLAWIKRK